MSRGGRPLRFLAMTLGGWTAGRAFVLWPMVAATTGAIIAIPALRASPEPVALAAAVAPGEPLPRIAPVGSARVVGKPAAAPVAAPPRPGALLALAALVRYGREEGPDGAITPPLRPTPIANGRSRLAGSAWAIARGGASGALLGGQLGASQAGARLTYALGETRRFALSARFASPLHGQGKEAAIGLDWQPTRAPLHLLAEQRFSLDGGSGGPTLLVIGGINPTPIAAGFRLEAYAQAGAIDRNRAAGGLQAFGDGAARLTRRIAALGAVKLDAGGGAWGAAQRGARRLDVGPTLGIVVPVETKALRLTFDWRERVAGEARPGSGPALSVGVDF